MIPLWLVPAFFSVGVLVGWMCRGAKERMNSTT
jgi:hypothetical protein